MNKRIIVGISGASGIVYGIRLLQSLNQAGFETHLVLSKTALQTCSYETDFAIKDIQKQATVCYKTSDMAASIASGSYKTLGMIIAPCSMRSLADIASGNCSNLLTRAADVILKERRRLVLMVRESPLHLGHLKNMVKVTEMGAIVAPPVPAFYNRPRNIDEIIDHSVGRVLDLFDIELGLVRRWGEKTEQTEERGHLE